MRCPLFLLFLVYVTAVSPARECLAAAGDAEYLQGIDALQAGKWQDAESAFAQAIVLDEENPDYYTARGVARTLAEKFHEAIKDFDRSLRLRDGDFETKLWLSAAYFMSDQPEKGSALFSHGREETHDYAEIVSNMSRTYMTSRYRGGYYDTKQQKWVDADGPVRTDFLAAAEAFAARRKSSGGAVSATAFERAKQLFDQGKFAEALADLDLVLPTAPDDPDLLGYHARAALELGDAIAARQELTRALTHRTTWANGYLARALAAAMMGDRRRADADLATAEALGADAGPMRARVERAMASASNIEPPALLAELRQAAEGEAPMPELIDQALKLTRAVNARRLKYDETYQDRLRELEAATRTIPTSAASLADLAGFLYTHATGIRGEAVEPRVKFTPYRVFPDSSRDAEIQRAEQTADAALQADPNHAKAMGVKAACLMWGLKWGDAEALLQRALTLQPDDARLLAMMSEILDHAANTRQAQAVELRTTDTWEDLTYIYWRYPTQAELRQADEYEAQAQRLWALARKHLQAAATARAGSADGFYYDGLVRRREGQADAARAAFEQAVKLKPDYIEAHDQLASVYGELGMTKEAFDQQSIAANLVHTTAGPMLRLAWLQVPRTAWKSAKEAIAKAESIDPADARCAAYFGRIAQGQEDPQAAAANFRVALALLEAQNQLRGTGQRTLKAENVALTLAVRMHLGQVLKQLGKHADALSVHEANTAMQARIPQQELTVQAPGAMLPDPNLPASEFPVADYPATYLAWSHVGAGEALIELNRLADAEKHFQSAREMEAAWPATAEGRNTLFEPSAWARLHLCRIMADDGRTEEAFTLMTHEGWPWNISDELKSEMEALQQKIINDRRAGTEDAGDDSMTTGDDLTEEEIRDLVRMQEEALDQQQREAERLTNERQRQIDSSRQQQRQRGRQGTE